MKQNINLIVKLMLLGILIILFAVIWHKSRMIEPTMEQPSDINFEINTSHEVYKEPVLKVSQEPELVDHAIEESTPVYQVKQYKVWEEEYFYAANVFKYFIQKGFTEEATAGIIGNMMIETSGGTLDLKPTIYSKSGNYYGLCQWSKKYYPEAHGLSFEQQLDYLVETMPWEFKTFGWLYKNGFNLEDFIKMTDVEDAAIAFTKVYERCSSASYELRKQAAVKAYDYFIEK